MEGTALTHCKVTQPLEQLCCLKRLVGDLSVKLLDERHRLWTPGSAISTAIEMNWCIVARLSYFAVLLMAAYSVAAQAEVKVN